MAEIRFGRTLPHGIGDGHRFKHQVAINVSRYGDRIEFRGTTTREHWAALISIPIDKIDELIIELERLKA